MTYTTLYFNLPKYVDNINQQELHLVFSHGQNG